MLVEDEHLAVSNRGSLDRERGDVDVPAVVDSNAFRVGRPRRQRREPRRGRTEPRVGGRNQQRDGEERGEKHSAHELHRCGLLERWGGWSSRDSITTPTLQRRPPAVAAEL